MPFKRLELEDPKENPIQDRANLIRDKIREQSHDYTRGLLTAEALMITIRVLIERLATLELIVSNLQARMDLNK